MLSLVGGLFGAFLFTVFNDRYTANISSSSALASSTVLPPTPTPSPYLWEDLISEASLRVVAIQVLKDNRLVRQGSGLIISSDGVIATSSYLAVSGAIYQVFYEGKIVKGIVADLDYKTNLLLLKVPDSYQNIADLGDISYKSGAEIMLVGKFMNIAKPTVFSQNGTISFVASSAVGVDTILDRIYTASELSGKMGIF